MDHKSKDSIDPAAYIQQFKELRARSPNEIIQVDFFGGEPLLHLPLIEQIIDGLKDDGNIIYSMFTNGLLVKDEHVEFFKQHNISISLSIDGLWQDRNRLQLNGKGTLSRLLEKREIFGKIPNVRCHTMIAKGCYNLLENHLWIKQHFGLNPELTLVRDVGTWDSKSVEKLKAGITELVNWYINNPQEEMPKFLWHYVKHFISYSLEKTEYYSCGAGDNIMMFTEGKVVPCRRFKDSPDMIEQIPKFIHMKECQSCEVRFYCKKGCLFEQIKNQGPIVELCQLYKYIYREISRMTAELQHNETFKQLLVSEFTKDKNDHC